MSNPATGRHEESWQQNLRNLERAVRIARAALEDAEAELARAQLPASKEAHIAYYQAFASLHKATDKK